MGTQLGLFDLAKVAPSPREQRAARAAEKQKEKELRRNRNATKRALKTREKQRLADRFPAVECCIYWYAPGSGWTHCHKCKKPLYPSIEKRAS